jgi:hypothetical protein
MHFGSPPRKTPVSRASLWPATPPAVPSPQTAPEVGRPPTVRRPLCASAKQRTMEFKHVPWPGNALWGTARPSAGRKGPTHQNDPGELHPAFQPQLHCQAMPHPSQPASPPPRPPLPTRQLPHCPSAIRHAPQYQRGRRTEGASRRPPGLACGSAGFARQGKSGERSSLHQLQAAKRNLGLRRTGG